MTPTPPPPRPSRLWVLGALFAVLGPLVIFLAIWRFLAPSDRRATVPYSDFVAAVHAGKVDEIRVQDRTITFRLRESEGTWSIQETVGPVSDQGFATSMKPDDASTPPPKIIFEK